MRIVDPNYHQMLNLSPDQETRWQADLDTLCEEVEQHEAFPLRIGDHYRELKKRWGNKAGALLLEAGISPYVARQRARIALAIPKESPLRRLGLSLSVLRMLAPLPDPQPWAEQALALQRRGELRVRKFAHMLEEAGLRQRRPRRRREHYRSCQHCRRTVAESDPLKVYVRVEEGEGWFCETRCAVEHLLEHAGFEMDVEWMQVETDPVTGRMLPPSPPEKRDSPSPVPTLTPAKRDSVSPAPEPPRPQSAQADFASTDRDLNPGPRPDVEQTAEGARVVLPGGLVVMTRRRST
jgi:hypothetical protein